jgi:hypothetical protein
VRRKLGWLGIALGAFLAPLAHAQPCPGAAGWVFEQHDRAAVLQSTGS